jgi:ferric iron reductase protein FhuF
MLAEMEELVFEDTFLFMEEVFAAPEPDPWWSNVVIHSGLFERVSPRTIWAAKELARIVRECGGCTHPRHG